MCVCVCVGGGGLITCTMYMYRQCYSGVTDKLRDALSSSIHKAYNI